MQQSRPDPLASVDAEYRFGRPSVYLAPRELARLSVLRSKLGDTPRERLASAAGRQTPPRETGR